MKQFVKIFCLLFGTLFAVSLHAQDLIYKKNGKVVKSKIIELGTGEIKYRLFEQPDGPIYAEDKENILKIVFEDGHSEIYGAARMDDVQYFEGQKKAAIKVSFLGPLLGYTNIIYERNIKPGRSWEVKAAFIGLGKKLDDAPRGFLATAAYKFYKKPDFYTSGTRRTHILQGSYIKPEFFIGHSSRITSPEIFGMKEERESSVAAGILLNLGKQWVFDNAFVLDLGAGIGYGKGVSSRSIYMFSDEELGFAGSINMSIGWTIK